MFGLARQARWGLGATDDAVEADQTQIVARAIDLGEAPGAPTLVACREEQREPHHRVASDLIEGVGGVPVAEIARPAANQPHGQISRRLFDANDPEWTGIARF